MLDLHSTYDATGSTDTIVYENNSNAVIPTGDGATTIGLSPWPSATMIAYGAHVVAAAQALVALAMQSNNLIDPTNKLQDAVNTTPTITTVMKSKFLQLPYVKGPNLVGYGNEAAGKTATFKIDQINVGTVSPGSLFPPTPGGSSQQGYCEYTLQNTSAQTAGVYSSILFNQTNTTATQTPPVGTYAILGARVYGLTTAAVIRFQHTDFGGAYPGFPVLDYGTGTLTSANQGGNMISSDSWQGSQFVQIGLNLGTPCCPVFRIQGQGTGLTVQILDTAADTPQIDLCMLKLS
jgi:hypothetical protein